MARALAPAPDPGQQATEDALFSHLGRCHATWGLLGVISAIHVALGLVMHARGNANWVGVFFYERGPRLLARAGAMRGAALDRGELWRLVSAVFLHGGPLHLVLNAVALYALGRVCEAVYGPVRFLWLFLLAGIGGTALSWVGANEASVGSSGGIFGLLGAAVVFGWRYRHQLDPDTSRFFRLKLVPWLLLNLVVGAVVPVVDQLGHVGGLVAGAVLATILGNRVVPGEDTGRAAHAAMLVGVVLLLAAAAWGVYGEW